MAGPTFDLVVVGCGGGPDETNLSAYLIKLSNERWEDGVVALEAGSGQGALSQLLLQNPLLFSGHDATRRYTSFEIYSFVRSFLITHAHLDHVNSLVISAGSLVGTRKRVYATKQTLEDLESVFADRIWPNLASWNEEDQDHKLLYTIMPADGKYHQISPGISVQLFPLNHGRNESGNYESAAFAIRHDTTSREFLFFGDVEPDAIAPHARTINVWRHAARKIPNMLSTIFIECSWPSGRPDDLLYGHLNPEHLTKELTELAREVVAIRTQGELSSSTMTRAKPHRKRQKRNPPSEEEVRGALTGVHIYIIHCKDNLDDTPDASMREVIVGQVRTLVEQKGLGAKISVAERGMCIRI